RCEAALAQWMPRPPGRRDGILRALLYTGFVQLEVLQLPPHAALAATVDAARVLGRAHQAGLVNALLRRAQRDGLPVVDAAASWPKWLLDMLHRDRPGQVGAIVQASAEAGPLWLRVNRRLATPDGMRERLAASRIVATQSAACPDALRIDDPVPVSALPGFADGELSVQDGSAPLVADALRPAPGARVLDACSAPGGKAAHLLERGRSLRLLALALGRAPGVGVLDAGRAPGGRAPHLLDSARSLRRLALAGDRKRLERVGATFARLAVDDGDVQLRVADAADTAGWWDGTPFDAIL